MLTLTACPEPGCTAPAEIDDHFTLRSTDGPVEHARTRCLYGHWFALPLSMLRERQTSTRQPVTHLGA